MGLGIGATPMVSIVKDIINNIKIKENEQDHFNSLESGRPISPLTPDDDNSNSNHTNHGHKVGHEGGNHSRGGFRTRKAYFYWVTREQGSFEWFKGIMDEVAGMDERQVIELHNYCTSVYEEGDARSALIAMLQNLNHAKHGVDVVSGTRVKSHFAKPSWRQVYKTIALQHPETRVGGFPLDLIHACHVF